MRRRACYPGASRCVILSTDPSLSAILWLATEARALRDPARLCSATCHHLVLAGIPVARSSWALQSADPRRFGVGLTWRLDEALRVESFDHGELIEDRFQSSPLRHIFYGGGPMRSKLAASGGASYPILASLAEEGFTDYLALPMRFADGRIHATTWATQAPRGFEDWQVDTLEALNHVLPLLLELWEASGR